MYFLVRFCILSPTSLEQYIKVFKTLIARVKRERYMNSLKKIILKVFPILMIQIVIGVLTMQSPRDTKHISAVLQTYCKVFFPFSSGRWVTDMHWFRSLLHVPLYFALGIIVAFCISKIWLSIGVCSLIALADETFKIYLPTREFEVRDIVFDAIGFLVGIFLVYIIKNIYYNIIHHVRWLS